MFRKLRIEALPHLGRQRRRSHHSLMLFLQLPLKRMTGVGPQNRVSPIDCEIRTRNKR